MATYAIGDIQGCYDEFSELLDAVDFQSGRDRLWLLGDLINRGSQNVAVVRRVMEIGNSAITVLGNHDLHFLAIHRGGHTLNRTDTFADLLEWKRVDEASDRYRHRPLLHRDKALGYVMAHAGVPHIWSLKQARGLAAQVEAVIQGSRSEVFFQQMYGNEPNHWREDWEGMSRWRIITNYFTRMRLIAEDGQLDFSHKGVLTDTPEGYQPWFELRAREPLKLNLLFGHWAALEGHTDDAHIIGLDTGCVWGKSLTALCLDNGEYFSVKSRSV